MASRFPNLRGIARGARRSVIAEYKPQFLELAHQRQQQAFQAQGQEQRAYQYGKELQAGYAQTLQGLGDGVQAPQNPLAAGGVATQAPMVDNWKGYLAALSASGGMSGGENAAKIATSNDLALGDLATKRSELLAKRGADIGDATSKAQQQAFINYATLEGLGIKKDSLAQQLALGQLNNQYKYDALGQQGQIANRNADLSQQRINATLRGQDISHQDRLASLAARNGGAKGLSPTQRRALQKANAKIRSGIQTGVDDLVPFLLSYKDKDGNKAYVDKDGSPNWQNIRYALNKRLGNDGDVVNAVVNLYVNKGYLSPKYAAALRRRHIGVPKSWLPPNAGGLGHPSTTSNGGGAGNYDGGN